jgi:RNA polymerase sigma factor (sigma-70 family)
MEDRELIDLVRQAAQGDRDATDLLVRTYMERVREHVSRRVGVRLRRRLETEDILQSSLALAVRDLEGKDLAFEGERPFVAWLLKITERKIQMAARHHKAGKRAMDRQVSLEEPERQSVSMTSPSQEAVRNERADRIRAALGELAHADRHLIEMRVIEGITFKEIAERLGGGTEDAVRQRYVRLLARVGPELRAALD